MNNKDQYFTLNMNWLVLSYKPKSLIGASKYRLNWSKINATMSAYLALAYVSPSRQPFQYTANPSNQGNQFFSRDNQDTQNCLKYTIILYVFFPYDSHIAARYYWNCNHECKKGYRGVQVTYKISGQGI